LPLSESVVSGETLLLAAVSFAVVSFFIANLLEAVFTALLVVEDAVLSSVESLFSSAFSLFSLAL